MDLQELICWALASVWIGVSVAGLTLITRGAFEMSGYVLPSARRALATKPLNCNLCMSFWWSVLGVIAWMVFSQGGYVVWAAMVLPTATLTSTWILNHNAQSALPNWEEE